MFRFDFTQFGLFCHLSSLSSTYHFICRQQTSRLKRWRAKEPMQMRKSVSKTPTVKLGDTLNKFCKTTKLFRETILFTLTCCSSSSPPFSCFVAQFPDSEQLSLNFDALFLCPVIISNRLVALFSRRIRPITLIFPYKSCQKVI